MNEIILPYDERLINCDSAFITPKGKTLFCDLSHEYFAASYCYDYEYSLLNLDGSGKLSEEEHLLFKKWLKTLWNESTRHVDFLVYMLSFDKVETIRSRTITTTSKEPYKRFYNYYLMDWNIVQLSTRYNRETNEFENNEKSNLLALNEREKLERELNELKETVRVRDRKLFFK